jgi:hypothetical protein
MSGTYLDNLNELIAKYRGKGIIVDANLMLLYCVGQFDIKELPIFKRLQIFSEDDYVILSTILQEFTQILTTPNIITEVNSLSNLASDHIKPAFRQSFRQLLSQLIEVYDPSAGIAAIDEFLFFGLTDAGIYRLAKQRECLVLTQDLRFSVYLSGLNVDVINFNHFRNYYMDNY